MKHTVCLVLAILSTLATASGQEEVLSAEISLDEWGIDDPAALRWGRVSVVETPKGEQLDVLLLREAEPQPVRPEVRTEKPAVEGNCVTVADFSRGGNTNLFGGYFNVFQRSPSMAGFDVDRRPHGRRTLRLTYHRAEAGFGGFWMHFYDFLADSRTLVDTTGLEMLTLWVRGREGGEKLLFKMADERLDGLDDSLPVGELGSFLPEGHLTTAWRRADVPLAKLPGGLDRSRMASLALEAMEGRGAVEIAHVALCGAGELPELPATMPEPPLPEPDKAIWVWNTAKLLADDAARAAFLTFLERQGFDLVYLQLPNETGTPARIDPQGAEALRALVGALNGLGLAVRALDGHASFVLPDKSGQVLETIEDVAAFNAAGQPHERFAGVHYDVEPYLLPGFGGPRREEILTLYVNLVARMTVVARRRGLVLGVDLPFWYDMPDEVDGEHLTVDFAGQRRVVTEHVIDLVDDVTLMDYRTVAYGPDGVLFHASGELDYAERAGKSVYVGLETGTLYDETYVTFRGEAMQGWPDPWPEGQQRIAVEVRGREATVSLVSSARGLDTSASVLSWPVTGRTGIPASKLTFDKLGYGALEATLRQALHELAGRPGFSGFALHYYGSLKEMKLTSHAGH